MRRRFSLLSVALLLVPAGVSCGEAVAPPAEGDDGDERVIVLIAENKVATYSAEKFTSRAAYVAYVQDQALKRLDWGEISGLKRYRNLSALAMTVDAARMERLSGSEIVRGIYEDHLNEVSLAESRVLVGAVKASAKGADGSGQTVAVVDTGVDAAHRFFGGRVTAEACFSSSGTLGKSKLTPLCPDGKTEIIGDGAAASCAPALSHCDHGTHVAGIAAGSAEDTGGVAPAAGIIAVQVFTRIDGPKCRSSSSCILAFDSDILKALDWILSQTDEQAIAAVNLSLGSGRFTGACDAARPPMALVINRLTDAGIAVVVASGNKRFDDAISAPACIAKAVSVGSVEKTGTVSVFSNSSATLDLLAPGGAIVSAVPGGTFALKSGTSMAAPHVAGAFAALRSRRAAAGLGVPELAGLLQRTGTIVEDARNGLRHRLIRLDLAVQALAPEGPGGEQAAPAMSPPPQPGSGDGGGQTRVIVELAAPHGATREDIARLRSELLAAMSGHHMEDVKGYESVPLVALTTDAEGMRFLEGSPLVRGVHADSTYEPMHGEEQQ